MIRVVAGIIERDERILICQRRAGKVLGLKWEFPGGKMRPSETPRRALERELREELGVTAEIGDVVDVVRHRYAEMRDAVEIVFLTASLDAGRIRSLVSAPGVGLPSRIVFERLVWARRADLSRYDFLAADRRVIARLVRGEISRWMVGAGLIPRSTFLPREHIL
jgi:8-oxo-dGTP diphosphatase